MDRTMSEPTTLSLPGDRVTASQAGFRWVAEWEPHEATWISWPHNLKTWPNRFEKIPRTFERLVGAIAEVEQVHVLGGPPESLTVANDLLAGMPNVTVHPTKTNDCWIRDFGPTFLLSNDGTQLGAVDWTFNAWGGKYPPFDDDADNARRICNIVDAKRFVSPLTCEGGSLETDGKGTLLTTSSCLLSLSRNADYSRQQVEEELMRELSVERVLWIDGGLLAGDDTDGHIDQLVRFIRPGLVVAALSFSSDDSNAAPLELQFQNLRSARDASDRLLEIIPLRTPPPRYIQGQRVPESYCNFYVANEIVIVPTFGFRETDEAAIRTLGELMPDRRMVPIDASDLIWGRGAFHCVTQQQPRIRPEPTTS
jgi:agmatine deiminase